MRAVAIFSTKKLGENLNRTGDNIPTRRKRVSGGLALHYPDETELRPALPMAQPVTVNRAMTAPEWTLLFALSVLWGGTFFFVAIAVKEIPPLTLVALRVGIAVIVLYVYLAATKEFACAADRSAWLAFIGMGIFNNAGPFALLNWWANPYFPAGVTAILLGNHAVLHHAAGAFLHAQ